MVFDSIAELSFSSYKSIYKLTHSAEILIDFSVGKAQYSNSVAVYVVGSFSI